jgi:predicted nucleotidyltransferase
LVGEQECVGENQKLITRKYEKRTDKYEKRTDKILREILTTHLIKQIKLSKMQAAEHHNSLSSC